MQTYSFLSSCVIMILGSSLDMLTRLLANQQRSQQPLSLLMLDIDHFKQIKDRFGHLAGDQALKLLADKLRDRLRTQDHAGRWGGEEFLVILPNTTAGGGLQVAENLRSSIASLDASHISPALKMSISIGLCSIPPTIQATPLQAIGRADEALYQAKQNGRNRVEAADIQSTEQWQPLTN